MKQVVPVIILALFLSLCFAFPAQSDSVLLSQDVEGNAVIKHNDIARGREDAIQDALQTVIANNVSRLLGMPVSDERFLKINKTVIEKADKYIANYKIVSENKQPFIYKVNVNVSLAINVLKDDLKNMGYVQNNQIEKTKSKVSLIVRGLSSYAQYNNLKEYLLERKNIIKKFYPDNFEWQTVVINADMNENVLAQNLADELEKTGRYSINATQINNNIIEIILFR